MTPSDDAVVFPTAVGQQGFWFLDQLRPGNPAYNIAVRFRIEGPLQVEELRRALGEVVRRHEALRTTFAVSDGVPMQVVSAGGSSPLAVDDLRTLPAADRAAAATAMAEQEAAREFDLARGPLFRARLLQLADDEHILLLTVHHIVADGWSKGIIARELGELYEAYRGGRGSPLAEPVLQYGDYAVWQRDRLASGELAAQLAYWRGQLAGVRPAEVPSDRPRPPEGAFRGAIESVVLPKELTEPLIRLSHQEGATFFMTSLACFNVFLRSYCPHDDLAVGSPVAGRTSPELESLVGLFINPVVLRANLSGDPTFLELLGRVRETVLDAFANQDVPFARVVREVRPRLDADASPLFRINYIFQRAFLKPFQGAGITLTPIPSVSPGAMYDLTFFMVERDEGWRASFDYCTDLYEPGTIRRLLDEFRQVMAGVAADPGRAISTLKPQEMAAGRPTADGNPRSLAAMDPADPAASNTCGDASERDRGENGRDTSPTSHREQDDNDVVVFPATVGQQGFWYLDQLRPGSPTHNVEIPLRLRGPLRVGELNRALDEVVRRHEALRTTFALERGEPVQVVSAAGAVTLAVDDLRPLPAADRAAAAAARTVQEAGRGFDLARGPLFRARMIQLADDEHILLLTVHHIVADGWSTGVIVRELGALYEAYCGGRGSPLAEPVLQYGDYAVWQRDRLASGELAGQLAYWQDQLAGVRPTEVPSDRPRPTRGGFRRAIESVVLPKELTKALGELQHGQKVTPFMVLLAAFQLVLQRSTGRDDICVGTMHAGRSRVELESLVGLFINPVVLRTDLSGDPMFLEVLGRVRETVLDAFANQDIPFARIVDAVNPKRDVGRHPIFDINFTLHRDFVHSVVAGNLTLTPDPSPPQGAMFDLNVFLIERADGLHAYCEYNSLYRDAGSVRQFLDDYRTLLSVVCSGPTRRLSELPSLATPQRALVPGHASGRTISPRSQTIHGLFEEQAAATPDAVAVVSGVESLTYGQLNSRANRLAHDLRRLGVGRGAPVGLYMERSADVVVGMLGILKAGGAYVPLDPGYPLDRLGFMIRDTKAAVILRHGPTAGRPVHIGGAVHWVDVDAPAIANESADNPDAGATADDLSHVMYTSGSTGRPKGVLLPHRGVVRLVRGTDYCRFGPDEVFLHHAPLTFDASTWEIWGPLLNGGQLVLLPPGLPEPDVLAAAIHRHGVTSVLLTAGLFHLMIEQRPDGLAPLRQLVAGGDVLSPPHVQRALDALCGGVLINAYGPTENSVIASCFRMTQGYRVGQRIPIGRPIANSTVYVLDEGLRPVPMGETGELYVGGDGVAQGYLNLPEQTRKAFLPNPFADDPASRLYRTGDRARYLPDGNLEFLGRLDGQLKLRGFRIEPGEIETALTRHPQVGEGVVVAREDLPGDRRLVAYVTTSGKGVVDPVALRESLKDVLPDYMVPAAIVVLPELPLTPNGKVDRAALPAPPRAKADRPATPRDEAEAGLFRIWEQVLGQSVVDAEADFFDEGGNSFLAMTLLADIEKEFGKKLSLGAFFQAPTVAATAAALFTKTWNAGDDRAFAMRRGGTRPPLVLVDAGPLFRPLVRELGPDQPVYGLALPNLSDLPTDFTVQDIAASLVDALSAAPIPGPYYLAGWSMAGVIAYEMAQQIRARGDDTLLLILFDTSNPNYLRSFRGWKNYPKRLYLLGAKLLYQFGKVRRMTVRQAWRYFRDRAQSSEARYRQTVSRLEALPAHAPTNLPLPLTWEFQYRAGLYYKPKPYDGPMLLVRSEFLTTRRFRDPKLGWGEVARGGLHSHEMPGEHDTMFFEPVVGQLAEVLTRFMDSAGRGVDVNETAAVALVE